MLCYSTDPLEKDVVITGDITVSLYIASDAPEMDFMVRLTDVDENGRSIKLADGILSAKYRNGFDHADFLNPGEVVPLTILTTKISNCFKKGHRIRDDYLQCEELCIPEQQYKRRFQQPDNGCCT